MSYSKYGEHTIWRLIEVKKGLVIAVCILFITNILTVIYFLQIKPKKEEYIFLHLEGQTEHWKMKNFIVSYTPTLYQFGEGTLTYTGNEKLEENIDYKVAFFNEKNDEYIFEWANRK